MTTHSKHPSTGHRTTANMNSGSTFFYVSQYETCIQCPVTSIPLHSRSVDQEENPSWSLPERNSLFLQNTEMIEHASSICRKLNSHVHHEKDKDYTPFLFELSILVRDSRV